MAPLGSTLLPTFATTRLTLRPRTLADLERASRWIAILLSRSPSMAPGPIRSPTMPSSKRASARRIRPAWATGPSHVRAVYRLDFLTPLDLHGPEIEIGWRLVHAAWGHGYATEAARPVLDHALHTLGLQRVAADIDPTNTGSISVARSSASFLTGLRSTADAQ